MPVQRGEIYFVNLNPVQGREQAGQRLVLVLSVDSINHLPLVVTVVVGTRSANVTRDYPTNVRVSTADSGLPFETVFLCFQLRSLDPSRFAARLPARFPGRCWRKSNKLSATVLVCRKSHKVHEARAHRFGFRRLPQADGLLAECEADALTRVAAWQIEREMKRRGPVGNPVAAG